MDYTQAFDELRTQLGIQTDFTHVMLAFALLMARVVPVVILTPFLGGESIPSEVRLGLGLMLGLVLYPVIVGQVNHIPVTAIAFIALMAKELFIGLTISFVVGIVFDAAQSAGSLVDLMSGTNQAQLMVPMTQQNTTLFSALNLQLTTVLFLTMNGHHLVIQALAESLSVVALDKYPHFSAGFWPFFDTILRVFGDMIHIAVALASPVLLATFMADLALGMINRVAPQVQVFFVSMQIKPAVTVLIMLTATHLILGRTVTEYGVMLRWLSQVVHLLK
jgi:flagellar biosynthetic protein FliR